MKARFWTKVAITANPDLCWLWRGSIGTWGYGRFMFQGKVRQAHRLSYEDQVGPIPQGLEIDHICRVRNCVNPKHLRAVTRKENLNAPGSLAGAKNRNAKHCLRGHEFTPENTSTSLGYRRCRRCGREREQLRRQALRTEETKCR